MKIFLIGFMGSGKTHWGKLLSDRLQLPFRDLDTLIVSKEQLSVADIFAEKGEEYFRYKEKETLEKLVQEEERFILSCGGGTPCFFNNIEFMKKNGKVIWLNTSVEVLRERLLKERRNRPLIKDIDDEGLQRFIIKKLSERRLYYQQADVLISEETVTPEEFLRLLFSEKQQEEKNMEADD